LISLTPPPIVSCPAEQDLSLDGLDLEQSFGALEATSRQRWIVFVLSVFLVSVPVFVQAPLVRLFPWYSLALTPALFWLGKQLLDRPQTQLWGDLMIGFTWTWFSGSIYWGWLRWEPLVHLPVEAIGLPFALWGISRGWGKVGNFFYIGSLSGTVVTDVYFYLTDLIPHWRSLMRVETEDLVRSIFQTAIAQIGTPQGLCWAGILTLLLLVAGLFPLRSSKLHWWAFGGAVISTLLVDGLFWLAAVTA
jgi:Protein of unknown function (DUF3120)